MEPVPGPKGMPIIRDPLAATTGPPSVSPPAYTPAAPVGLTRHETEEEPDTPTTPPSAPSEVEILLSAPGETTERRVTVPATAWGSLDDLPDLVRRMGAEIDAEKARMATGSRGRSVPGRTLSREKLGNVAPTRDRVLGATKPGGAPPGGTCLEQA